MTQHGPQNRRDVALAFVRAFCAGDPDRLRPLLTEDLRFRGPLLRTDSRETYLAHLATGSADPMEARVLRVFEDADEVCVFYELSKPSGALVVAQRHRFRGDRIAEISVVFDARGF